MQHILHLGRQFHKIVVLQSRNVQTPDVLAPRKRPDVHLVDLNNTRNLKFVISNVEEVTEGAPKGALFAADQCRSMAASFA